MLENLDILTEKFYKYLRVMSQADGDAINLALVSLRARIDVLEKPVLQAVNVGARKCPKCGAPVVQRNNRITGAPFLGCSNFPDCRWAEHL